MKRLLILGAGGHGKVVTDAALCSGWDEVAFLDDRLEAANSPGLIEVIGSLDQLPSHVSRFSAAVVAIGRATRRLELLDACRAHGFELPPIVHPSAAVSRFAALGPGCVVFAQAAINPGAVLGEACIVSTGATVDHDCELGRGVHVCPGAHLAGSVRVGDRTWIGIGAVVRQGIRIGRDVTIGAGAAVVADINDGVTAVGVPAVARGRVE